MAKKRRTPLGAVSLEAINAKIDRKKLSLRDQTLRAERRVKATGTTRAAAMIAIAKEQVAGQSKTTTLERRPSTESTKKLPLRPKRPKSPFGDRRRPNPKKVTRRGGRQPRKR